MITLYAGEELKEALAAPGTDLREIFIVSGVAIKDLSDAGPDAYASEEVDELKIGVAKAPGDKCERCWVISEELGANPEHPALCPRCAAVMAEEAQA
jgi:isoleucyl-tRNA synthetase